MYLEFYRLKELPFALTPDPRYVYFTPSHTEAMANLHVGIEHGKGLIVVTGEVGTGKTTVLRWMMQRLERTVLVAYIFNPRLSVPEFYNYVARLLGVTQWSNKSDLLFALGRTLEQRHERGLRTVLIVDEAHGLEPDVLEEIRLLSNFESNSAKLMQIVLTGQPELREVLNDPRLRQLKQRVALRCDIKPLPSSEEVERYISFRLMTAGAESVELFDREAIDMIFRCSEGIPRQINNLCDNALLAGFGAEVPVVTQDIIISVAETFDLLPHNIAINHDSHAGNEQFAAITDAPPPSEERVELWSNGTGDTANAALPNAHGDANGGRSSNSDTNGHRPDKQSTAQAETVASASGVGKLKK